MNKMLVLIFILISSSSVSAQTRCQCTYKDWIGDCQAKVELKGKWFKIISNTQQCSRVDWYIDGNPQLTIVTDGAEMEEWLGQSKSPELAIQSCKICKDSQYSSNQLNNTPSTEKLIMGAWSIDRWIGKNGSYQGYLRVTQKYSDNHYSGEFYARNPSSGNWGRQRMDIRINGNEVRLQGSVIEYGNGKWFADSFHLQIQGDTMTGLNRDTKSNSSNIRFIKD